MSLRRFLAAEHMSNSKWFIVFGVIPMLTTLALSMAFLFWWAK